MRVERLALALAAALLIGAAHAAEPIVEETTIPLVLRDATYALAATVLRPAMAGRHPAIVLNHGAWGPAPRRREIARLRMEPSSAWFVERGYLVVVPMRRGYGASEGEFAESSGPCEDSDYLRSARVSADDIVAAVAWARARADVDPARIVIVGFSAGGWGALGAVSRAPAGVVAIVNVSGGRGGFAGNGMPCRPERIYEAAAALARQSARVPTLWLYAENDALFGPAFSPRLADAWRAGGGDVEFHLLPRFVPDGHGLFLGPDGVEFWAPFVASFLARTVR